MHGLKPSPALDRRSFLYRAMRLAAVPAFPALLSACGGGGSDSDDSSSGLDPNSAATATLAGQVVLPANLSLAGARVGHLLGDEEIASTGGFVINFVPDSVAFTQVRDASAKVLLFGFLRAEQTDLTVHSTAEALVFRSLGLWAHPPKVRVAALTLLRSEDLTAVEAAIGAVIAAHGSAWTTFAASSGVGTAVLVKVAALSGNPPAGAQARKSAQGMIVTPEERLSGLIVEGDGIGACKVTNAFRRRSLVFHTAVSAKLDGDPEPFDLPLNLIKTEVSPTDGVSNPLEFIANLFPSGKTYYTPLSVNLLTPLFPSTAAYTKYKIYAVGPGLAFGTWSDLPQTVKDQGILLMIKSVILDFALPLLASVIVPWKAEAIDDLAQRTEANDVLKDLINAVAAVPELTSKLLSGDFKGCCEATVTFIRGTDTVQIALLHSFTLLLQAMFGTSVVVNSKTGRAVSFDAFIHDTWSAIDGVFDAGEFALTLFDSAVQACDIASSRFAETWDVNVTKAKVNLNPPEFFVEKNTLFTGITALAVGVTEVAGKVVGYTWKCGAGHLSDGTKYAAFIDSTTSNLVAYDAVDVPAGTVDQIDVKVFLSGLGTDDPVGSAKTKVYVTGVTVSPTEKKLKANESVTLTAQTVGMRPLAAGETVTYRWTLGGTAGTLTATDTATATFKADATKQGLGLVTVEASLGGKRIGTAQTTLTVGDKLVVAGRVYEDHSKDASGCHTGMHIAIPKITGATSYSVFVSGMRGPIFGTEYTWTVFVTPAGVPVGSMWAIIGNEIVGGIGGGNGGGDECVAAPDQRWAQWYEGSTVEVTVTL